MSATLAAVTAVAALLAIAVAVLGWRTHRQSVILRHAECDAQHRRLVDGDGHGAADGPGPEGHGTATTSQDRAELRDPAEHRHPAEHRPGAEHAGTHAPALEAGSPAASTGQRADCFADSVDHEPSGTLAANGPSAVADVLWTLERWRLVREWSMVAGISDPAGTALLPWATPRDTADTLAVRGGGAVAAHDTTDGDESIAAGRSPHLATVPSITGTATAHRDVGAALGIVVDVLRETVGTPGALTVGDVDAAPAGGVTWHRTDAPAAGPLTALLTARLATEILHRCAPVAEHLQVFVASAGSVDLVLTPSPGAEPPDLSDVVAVADTIGLCVRSGTPPSVTPDGSPPPSTGSVDGASEVAEPGDHPHAWTVTVRTSPRT